MNKLRHLRYQAISLHSMRLAWCLVLGSFSTAGQAMGHSVPYCAITAVQGQAYIKVADNPFTSLAPIELCPMAEADLVNTLQLQPTGARDWGYVDTGDDNAAVLRCEDGYVEAVEARGLYIIDILKARAAGHFRCLFSINH